ncbi:MAG: S1 RNA-binding domain-containing protein, partial [Myxococcota bacterium]|nr:S1 RNA-binding domain-containing protein [Myxococcota bacterium]
AIRLPQLVIAEQNSLEPGGTFRLLWGTGYDTGRAFVEVEPGLEGLVHVSEMSWKRVKHPKDAVRVGDLIEASVIRCDPEQQRLKLSMKSMEANPWEEVRERYPSGTKITAKVRNVREWGIFLGVEEGIDGLVHISDLAWGNSLRRPSDRFRRGQEVEALVMEVDVERERMSLGIKQLTADPTRAFFDTHAPGDIVSGAITGLAIWAIGRQHFSRLVAVTAMIAFLFATETLKATTNMTGVNLTTMWLMLGIWQSLRGRAIWAGVLFGFAACTGFYSMGAICAALVLGAFHERRFALRQLGGFLVVAGVINGVFFAMAGEAYLDGVYRYHGLKAVREAGMVPMFGGDTNPISALLQNLGVMVEAKP